MKCAIVTPYLNEKRETLDRCIASVASQTVAATHFLVADGHPQNWIDEAGVQHLKLDRAHRDYGNTARLLGFLLAAGEEYEAVGFLDADCFLDPDHIETCLAAAERAGAGEEVDIMIARRRLVRSDGSELPLDDAEIDAGVVDPNCHFVMRGGFHSLVKWGVLPRPVAAEEGRVIFYNLKSERLVACWTDRPTVSSECVWESVYLHLGEVVPEGSKPVSKDPVWVIGDGRSGTTWLMDLINYNDRYRSLFEPFHGMMVKKTRFLPPNQYVRPDGHHEELSLIAEEVFRGEFHDPWVNRSGFSPVYHGVLIKDIYANLFARWASLRFPGLKIVLILRHPFSVAASKHNAENWRFFSDPLELLNQTDLYLDYLHEHEGFIRKVNRWDDYVLRQVLIWAIINSIPLRQFSPGEIHVVLYEKLLEDPYRETGRIFSFLGHPEWAPISRSIIDRPSKVTIERRSRTRWEQDLSRRQVRRGVKILERFGLDDLYNEDTVPDEAALIPLMTGPGEGDRR